MLAKKRIIPALLILFSLNSYADKVKTYVKDVDIKVNKSTISQKRWYLENSKVRLAVIDDPGGAVVEFVNKATGTDHVAGQVYKTNDIKKTGWGWVEWFADDIQQSKKDFIYSQPFKVEFLDIANGAKSIKVVGHTKEQKVERVMTLKPDSPELSVKIKITNISGKERPLWLRWHPRMFASKDTYGKSGCMMVPDQNSQVRKIRIAWGWDHWLKTVDGCWLIADFKSGDGVFGTYEKENIPLLMTWTQYKRGKSMSGALTVEPYPSMQITAPGKSIEARFTYYPFSKNTDPQKVSLGVIKNPAEQKRVREFLKKAMPLAHMEKFGGYTLARTDFFDWMHRRRDRFGLRDWGFADCAIVGYPLQKKALKVRMLGAAFKEASKLKGFPRWQPGVRYIISVKKADNTEIYRNSVLCQFSPGIPGLDNFDREVAIPMADLPDGSYTLSVEAIDPITKKPFHKHQRALEVIGNHLKKASEEFRKNFKDCKNDRKFVKALFRLDAVEMKNGRMLIPIGVEDASGCSRNNFPVRLGVPFPKGTFQPDVRLRLFSPDGKEVNAQFRVMNIWPDKSLKWLQVDFQASCPSNSYSFYKLEINKNKKDEQSKDELIKNTPEGLRINTGPMLVVIDKRSDLPVCNVYIDQNKNGKFEATEKMTSGSLFKDIWWQNQKGERAFMRLNGKKSGIFKPGVSIEENGPLAAVVKIQGWYKGKDKNPAYGELRIQFFKNKAYLKVFHQVTFAGNPWVDELSSYGLGISLKPELFKYFEFDIDGKPVSSSGNSVLLQKTPGIVSLSNNKKIIAKGSRSNGAVMLKGTKNNFLFYHLNFWQMFPKKITADPSKGNIVIAYWPEDAGIHSFAPDEEYWIPSSSSPEACGTGASRTDEMIFDFSGLVKITEAPGFYGEPVVACTPPKWVQETAALGKLQAYDPEKIDDIEDFMSEYIDFHNRHRGLFKFYGHWNYGTLHNVYRTPMYQWLLAGRYANIGNEEDIVRAPWLLYFRSGDRKYLKFAELWTRHLMEIQSIRWHNLFPAAQGMSRRHHRTPWLGNADYGHTMLCQYLEYYHATGYRPAWEMAKMTAEAMKRTYKGVWRYLSNPIVGNMRMYLETGEEHYKKTADRIWKELCYPAKNEWWGASHGSRMVRWYAPYNEQCMKAWKEWIKKGAPVKGGVYKYGLRNIDSLAEMSKMTNDPWYAHMARVNYDKGRAHSTGLIHGVNPVLRGMVPYVMNTQQYMGLCRTLAIGKDEIEKSRKLFPAGFYHLGYVKGIIIKEDKDESFKIFISGNTKQSFKIISPDGKPADIDVKEIFNSNEGRKSVKLFEIIVKKDNKAGIYLIKPLNLDYFGCSLKNAAIIVGSRLKGSGDALYVKSNDLGAPEMKIIMNGSPGCSLELFTLGGKRLFSKSMLRPSEDAVGVVIDRKIPVDTILRLGDRTGIVVTGVKTIPLYLNRNGIFNIPGKYLK